MRQCLKTDIDFQIDKNFETSERNQFFHPSIKASATDYQWTPMQWADYQWTPVDRLIDYIYYISRA